MLVSNKRRAMSVDPGSMEVASANAKNNANVEVKYPSAKKKKIAEVVSSQVCKFWPRLCLIDFLASIFPRF